MKTPGRCKFSEHGIGWKPSGGGDPFTMDRERISAASFTRGVKGYELKILSRESGVIQLDGFEQEVSGNSSSAAGGTSLTKTLTSCSISTKSARISSSGMASTSTTENARSAAGIGAKPNSARQSSHSTSRVDPLSKSHTPKSRIPTWRARTKLASNLHFQKRTRTARTDTKRRAQRTGVARRRLGL